ncbi:kinesin-like protein KIN-14I [Medicago truncatula]|uniref:P-loop nucleoside triphosphate hydrolase superfamily protein n=1 Tax=Medicago truncatula TaxID=3880 RepID=G7IEJ0_MEDTR|nr:kinesin-like protein KIN-14I [Medicago truncatula]AES61721.2 P-loop nucleoside triphosphate hydrolase superfamily protein [Medicago truncatula]
MAALSFSVASVVEDVLQQHGTRLKDLDLESRKSEEAALRRYEAAGWLRKMVGVVAAKDLPAEPSEEEFRLGLRSGIILCNVLNKVHPGSVSKVVESPVDSALIPDGAPLSAFQYFENVRNFLVAIQEIGIPTFEASDLEQGGKSSRIVSSVLALKSYSEWKQTGANGVWKFGGTIKPAITAKSFVRKNSEPFTNSLSRTSSINEKSMTSFTSDVESNKMSSSHSLGMLVRAILFDKKPEEVPMLVESVLAKVVEEFEHRITSQDEQTKTTSRSEMSQRDGAVAKFSMARKKVDNKIPMVTKKEEFIYKNHVADEESQRQLQKQQMLFDQRQRDIQELKHTVQTTKAGMQFMQMKFHEEFSNLGMHIHGLAHAASGYHRVLEENRKLYNEVQDLKGSIRVYCRVRPFLPGQPNHSSTVENIEDGVITINVPSKNGKGRRSFNFNKVFGPSAAQGEVFADMQPLVRSVLDGFNVCIFAYGQTGSGKTFTMTGPKEITEKSQGVNYRALSDLFYTANQRKDTFRYDVSVQMIEIYNEQVRDLLVTDGTNKRLEIRSNSQRGLSVPDASLVQVSSTNDVIELMNLGHKNRAVGATALNDRSSRSHSCLTVHVQGRDLTSGAVLRGCMHLVDLAGSERVDKSEATGDRLKEAQHINKSLSALGDVIASLAQKNQHVPYRNSKLTQLLQDSLGGQAKTLMFVHISPEANAVGETISTLKFAERVATVELGAARVNKDGADVKELKEQIASLKAALARKEGNLEHSISGSSGKCRTAASERSPYHASQRAADIMDDPFGCRQPVIDVGNLELLSNTISRQRTQSFDFDETLTNSPPWPPVNSLVQNCVEDDKETGTGEWVDKVMVNKLDVNKTGNMLGCWEADNGNLSEEFYQKYLQDSSKVYSERSYNMFMRGNQFNIAGSDDTDDVDAATSDSSEHDLLWQFNHSKVTSVANGNESKGRRFVTKSAKSTELSKNSIHSSTAPSPSRKQTNGVAHRTPTRQPAPVDMKRKTGTRK